jgi:hypothetical protein
MSAYDLRDTPERQRVTRKTDSKSKEKSKVVSKPSKLLQDSSFNPDPDRSVSPKRIIPAPKHILDDLDTLSPVKDILHDLDPLDGIDQLFPELPDSPLTFDNSDNFDFNMAESQSSVISPAPYRGKRDPQDPASFLANLESYMSLKGKDLTDEQKISYLRLLLRDSATIWLNSLKPEEVKVYKDLKEAFLVRFSVPKQKKWLAAQKLYTETQRPSEGLDEFIERLLSDSTKIGLSDNEKSNIILSALPQDIRSFVIREEPADLSELIEAARLAACSIIEDTNSPNLVAALTKLEAQINSLTVGDQRDHRDRDSRYTRSPSPGPYRGRSQSPARGDFSRRSTYQGQQQRHVSFANQRPQRQYDSNQSRNYNSNYSSGQDFGDNRKQFNNNNNRAPFRSQNNYQRQANNGQRQVICWNCNLAGHRQATCKFARRSSQESSQ